MNLIAAGLLACSGCGGNDVVATGDGSTDLPAGNGDGGGGDSGNIKDGGGADTKIADGGFSCAATGMACVTDGSCCKGYCDVGSKTCALMGCGAQGAACAGALDCCNLTCVNKVCGAACKPNGTACGANGECCTQNCAAGSCAPIAPGCTTAGNKCAGNGDCCSANCQGGLCAPGGGGCNVIGDICLSGVDCCSGLCTIPMGMQAGTCQAGGGGGCTQDGEVCPGCQGCCSRVCATTQTGGNVCQPAGGCRLLNDLCHIDADCCGGPQLGQTQHSVGQVTCVPIPNSNPPIGTCSQPGGAPTCNPEGDVCGIKPPQACSGNAREDCCDCISPKFNCCKFDNHGVARCFGGSTVQCPLGYTGTAPCCIATGSTCTFSNECCGGQPCVPDVNGVLRCGAMCQPVGKVCTATSDCCLGLTCVIPKGQLIGMCGSPPMNPPPDGGVGDGGVAPDAGACGQLGQHCSTVQPCCPGLLLNCAPPGGVGSCAVGEMDCSCVGTIG